MDKKYELTSETKKWGSIKLFRIKALKEFGLVRVGDLGGWVEGEHNLSHECECWIYDEGVVAGDAVVRDDAEVHEHAKVYGNAIIRERARIFGHAVVYESAHVCGRAIIGCNAQVHYNAVIKDEAQVQDNAEVTGKSKIHDNAIVRDMAIVDGKSLVKGDAVIAGSAIIVGLHITSSRDYVVYGPMGSRNSFITISTKHNYIATGCWRGTREQFIKAVKKTHDDNQYAQEYLRLIEYVFKNGNEAKYTKRIQELQKAYKSLLEEAKALYEYSPFASKMSVDEYFSEDKEVLK